MALRPFRLALPLLAALSLSTNAAARAGQAAIAMEGYPPLGSPSTAKLSAPGREPRVPLRYTMPVGAKAMVNLTVSTEISMNFSSGLEGKVPMTSFVAGIELTVTGVSPEGDLRLDVGILSLTVDRTNPRVDLAAARQVEAELATLTPMRGSLVITNRGISTSGKPNFGAVAKSPFSKAIDGLIEQIEQITPILPEEPVGVGAKWEMRRTVHESVVTAFERSEVEVTSISNDVIRLKTTIHQTAPRQEARGPDELQGISTVTVEKFSGRGNYNATVSLASLAPTVQGTQTTSLDMRWSGLAARLSGTIGTIIKPTSQVHLASNAPADKPVSMSTNDATERLFALVEPCRKKAMAAWPDARKRFLAGLPDKQSITIDEADIVDWMISRPDGTEEGNWMGKFLDAYQVAGRAPSGICAP